MHYYIFFDLLLPVLANGTIAVCWCCLDPIPVTLNLLNGTGTNSGLTPLRKNNLG